MKIIRNGKEIELTSNELKDAYYECEHKWDVSFLREQMEYVIEYDNYELVELAERFLHDDNFADRVAYRYRKYADDYPSGDEEWDCITSALKYIAKETYEKRTKEKRYLCDRCIQAIRSRGEKMFVGEQVGLEYEVFADEPQMCDWCGEEASELYEVIFV